MRTKCDKCGKHSYTANTIDKMDCPYCEEKGAEANDRLIAALKSIEDMIQGAVDQKIRGERKRFNYANMMQTICDIAAQAILEGKQP